ncbi:unnamed protein product [Mycena citricolor]|uniref:SH3 domain-containing protein n=1 Tax=Mycena citricolor TaxID=2018698 RepID=A0AAD2H0Z3_9AGAR|nr:unnamed protein product [Mycena citricolor]
MAIRRQPSSTSLARYAVAKSPGVDLYNGSTSRDFCNSFWGAGDAGVNVLFARMRGASRTTDELRNFWKERATIEEEYAARMMNLAKATLGKDEIGELRNSLDTLSLETEKQGVAHLEFASQIRSELEAQTTAFLSKQITHRKNLQGPLEKRFKVKQTQESYTLKAREKYESDCLRIASYSQQISVNPGKDVERLQLKLRRAQQTVQANEKDFANFTKTVMDMTPLWERDWKNFCDASQDLEEDRLDFMRDIIWMYANAVSTLCVSDDQSCERIRSVLDQLEPDKDIENFVEEYGTGNSIPDPPVFVPYPSQQPDSSSRPTTSSRTAEFERASVRPVPAYGADQDPLSPSLVAEQIIPTAIVAAAAPIRATDRADSQSQSDAGSMRGEYQDRGIVDPMLTRSPNGSANVTRPMQASPVVQPTQPPPPAPPQVQPQQPIQPPPTSYQQPDPEVTLSRRASGPLPPQPSVLPYNSPPVRAPTPQPEESGRILFYVKALYDYTATIAEEFDFQAGDVIAVTATPDDGWWSGELLDEARREEGRHVFPSNFVVLF